MIEQSMRDPRNQEVARRQEECVPKEDTTPYVDQWIAVRKGRIVASNPDPAKLCDDPSVKDTDALMPVLDPKHKHFF